MYLLRLMLLTPGTIQSKPEMGVGLVSIWRYSDSSELDNLKLEIQRQVSTYLPQFQLYNVRLQLINKELLIEINLDHMLYSFITDNKELKLYQL